jgi:hypothetical protein
VIYTAVRLGLPDKIAQGLSSAEELASASGTDPRSTFRLMRALAVLGLCRHLGGGRFALTESGELLRTEVPNSLAITARHWGDRAWRSFSHLEESVRTGAPMKDSGRAGFESFAHRPEDAAIFNQAMAAQTAAVASAIVAEYDFSRFRSVIDVGGGYGALIEALLKRHPQLTAASADMAYMEHDAQAYLSRAGVADRARFIPTDFFSAVPPGADCYLLKYIIHDWGDADSIAILRNTRAALADNGVVLIIEQVAPELAQPTPQHLAAIRTDLHMLSGVGGMERTITEYRELLGASHLRLTRVIPTASAFSIIEAVA